ncbi:glycine betaine ABC transporter substrate-binding protein [Desertibacillus haloalkaliphilus]|uniref:glycine betaine ABC transporter substrate-binding protein n=1 Tax=Desertibacillus haloalkaliphilus TaxID=1328930 RepID=UPI001C26C142|nr:glycine betaine ABC transporter substrate-binding protein [Desertibacillus haloalkaliphilus]MBU8908381.1 glycine betaine ABC transporter substrate-binding protein [Desertibacillus haloalkaliphilus]
MKKYVKLSFLLPLFFTMVLGCAPAEEEDAAPTDEGADRSDITITLGLTPWTSTIPPTEVAKSVLEEMGYTVNIQSGDAGAVYTGLSRGDIDVFMDAWLPDMHANYMERYGDSIDDVAVSYPNGELGWVVPEYVEGIDSVEDIQGNEDMFEGTIYGIEEGAGLTVTTREMIEAYDLDLELVTSSEAGMLSQARRVIGDEEPVLFLGWRPHPMFVNWDLKVLEDPQGFVEASEVHVLTNHELENKAPEAYEFLSNWSMPVEDIEEMIVQIEEGIDEDVVAQQWIEENQEKINEMKPDGEEAANENEES